MLGLIFGLAMGVYVGLQTGDAIFGVVGGLLGGLFFGAVMGPFLARMNRRALTVLDAMPAGREREVQRAVSRGPIPTDPQVREAALRAATYQLGEIQRIRVPVVVGMVFFLVLEVVTAILVNPWLWWGAALFAAVLAVQVAVPRHLSRRIERLRAG